MAKACIRVGAKAGLGCKGLSLQEARQPYADWASRRKGCNGLEVAVRGRQVGVWRPHGPPQSERRDSIVS